MTERVGTFVDKTTCWEYKTDEILSINEEKNVVICTHQEIPAFTRLLETKARLVFIRSNQQKYSLHKVEIQLKADQETPPNSESSPLSVISCFTPATNQHMGWALVPNTDLLAKIHANHTTVLDESNCILLTDVANDWVLYLYCTRHLKKGESLKIFQSQANTVAKPDTTAAIASPDAWKMRLISPWLPLDLHFLAEYVSPFLLDSFDLKELSITTDIPPLAAWQLFVLIHMLKMFLDPKKNKIHHLVNHFNTKYCANRQSSPFILQALFLEGVVNAKVNSKYFAYFSAHVLLNAKSTDTRIK